MVFISWKPGNLPDAMNAVLFSCQNIRFTMWTQICGNGAMEKYPLTPMRQTLVEWKYLKKYPHELKSYEIHEKASGELEIHLKNKIKIVNKGGSIELKADPVKFLTTSAFMASFDEESENERLKNYLSDFDNTVYIKAQDAEGNTMHRNRFFEK
ncbi:MAG: hypothetical protein ABIN36_05880 [Ferruginibacter sp.]